MTRLRQPHARMWATRFALIILFAGLAIHFIATHRPAGNTALVTFSPPALDQAAQEVAAAEVESALARLEFDAAGRLLISAETEAVLGTASDALPDPLEDAMLSRLQFLIGKQFAAPRAEQVEALLRGYLDYRQAKRAWLTEAPEPRSLEEEAERFAAISALQDRELGADLANSLYGEHRRIAEQMFAAQEAHSEDGNEY